MAEQVAPGGGPERARGPRARPTRCRCGRRRAARRGAPRARRAPPRGRVRGGTRRSARIGAPKRVPHVRVVADVDVGLGLAGHHRLGARDVGDLVEHGPAGAVGGSGGVVGAHGAAEVDDVLHGLGVRVDQLAEVAGRRGVQRHAATVPTLVGMATPEHPPVESAPGVARALGLAVVAGLVGAVVAAVAHRCDRAPGAGRPRAAGALGRAAGVGRSTLASAATVGLLGLAAFLAPERTRTHRRVHGHPVRRVGRRGVGGGRAARGRADLRRPRRILTQCVKKHFHAGRGRGYDEQ